MSRLYPCVYCTEDGYCKKFSDEEVKTWYVQSPCEDERPSNADKIRAMSDEELADFLYKYLDCTDCPIECDPGKDICLYKIMEWLKKESE